MAHDFYYYGAIGDGVHDDTTNIQDALLAEIAPIVTPGRFRLTATLYGQPNQVLQSGLTPELCQFVRDSAYGPTLKFGTDEAHAGAVKVSGIWFNHTYEFNNGLTYVPGTSYNILNKDPNSAHVQIYQGQNVEVGRIWVSGLGWGVDLVDSTVVWVEKVIANGMWDAFEPGLQDTTSSLSFRASAPDKRCAVIDVTQCHFGGYGSSAARTVTTGNASVTKTPNNGPRFGIYMTSGEKFDVHRNYLGGHSENNLFINANATINHGHVDHNMFDAARTYSMRINSTTSQHFVNQLEIANNTGIGYGLDEGFLHMEDSGGNTSGMGLQIHDNKGQMYAKTPIRLDRVYGAEVHDNTFGGYNCDGSTISDPYVQSGMIVGPNCADIHSHDNTWGGGVTDPRSANHCKWGEYFSNNVNHSSHNINSNGLGEPGGTLIGGPV